MGWSPPSYVIDRHGTFVAYIVKCQTVGELVSTYRLGNMSLVTVDRLLPFHIYNCCVSLQTTMGNSTESCQQQRTAEDGNPAYKSITSLYSGASYNGR